MSIMPWVMINLGYTDSVARFSTDDSPLPHFFIADTRSAWFWLAVRLYLSYEWLTAGWAKITSPDWVGSAAGKGLIGFAQSAVAKLGGTHPDVQLWYAWFLTHAVLPHAALFSNLMAFGEVAVGLALLAGFLTGLSAIFGIFMNLNYLLGGSLSINPEMLLAGIGLMLAWRVSGYLGLDRWILPRLHKSLRPKNL
jgi:thiosulfate dehydrogenase (quinone) large subunit